jgi:hypothetical protein
LADRSSKLVALVLIAVVVAAGAGYWIFTPKMPNEFVSTAYQTSLLTPLERTSSESTILASATTVASDTTVWLNVSATQPVSYYLSLLESNGTQPYVQLARELRKIPGLTNATAVAKITYLALNASNPEVKEAFELMMKGGTPSANEYSYNVPSWNTDLWALYQLAEDNQFEKDDTTALAIVMVDGFFRTMGDDQVLMQIRVDDNRLLNLAREISSWQTLNGYYVLDSLPLEAKINWAWRGSENLGYSFIYLRDEGKRIGESVYSSRVVSVSTLEEMRQFVMNAWLKRDIDQTMKSMENLYIQLPKYWAGSAPTWTLNESESRLLNANYVWQYFKAHGKGIGVCVDESTFVDALAKSVGIATVPIEVGGTRKDNSKLEAHAFVLYYDPYTKLWKSYNDQVEVVETAYKPPYWIDLYLPPVGQTSLLWSRAPAPGSPPMFATAGYRPTIVNIGEVDFLVKGIATSKLRDEVMLPFYLDGMSTIPSLESVSTKEAMITSTTTDLQRNPWETIASCDCGMCAGGQLETRV